MWKCLLSSCVWHRVTRHSVRDILQTSSHPLLLRDNKMRIFTLCIGYWVRILILISRNIAATKYFVISFAGTHCILIIMGAGTLSVDNEVGGALIVCKQWRALPTLLSVSSFRRPCLVCDRSWQCVVNKCSCNREPWGAFHQAFCQCFSLTTVISYWNPCIWLAESKFVSEKHWQNAWWNAPQVFPAPSFRNFGLRTRQIVSLWVRFTSRVNFCACFISTSSVCVKHSVCRCSLLYSMALSSF